MAENLTLVTEALNELLEHKNKTKHKNRQQWKPRGEVTERKTSMFSNANNPLQKGDLFELTKPDIIHRLFQQEILKHKNNHLDQQVRWQDKKIVLVCQS